MEYPIILLSEYSFRLFTNGVVILKKVLAQISLGKTEVHGARVLFISIPQGAKYLTFRADPRTGASVTVVDFGRHPDATLARVL